MGIRRRHMKIVCGNIGGNPDADGEFDGVDYPTMEEASMAYRKAVEWGRKNDPYMTLTLLDDEGYPVRPLTA
jgi:hypothetical protein